MNYQYDCPHCAAVTVIPEDADFNGSCGSCDKDVFRYPVEDLNDETPATAPTVNGGTESIPEHSITTAYLAKHSDSTRHTYGTWAGVDLPVKDYVNVIIPLETARGMYADGPQPIALSVACVNAQAEVIRQRRREEELKRQEDEQRERDAYRRRLRSRVSEEFSEELDALDRQVQALYGQIDARVDAILNNEEMAP